MKPRVGDLIRRVDGASWHDVLEVQSSVCVVTKPGPIWYLQPDDVIYRRVDSKKRWTRKEAVAWLKTEPGWRRTQSEDGWVVYSDGYQSQERKTLTGAILSLRAALRKAGKL